MFILLPCFDVEFLVDGLVVHCWFGEALGGRDDLS